LPTDTLRKAIFALALGSLEIMISGTSAKANAHETYRTSCNGNDCVRYLCDDGGRDCFLIGYFDRRDEGRPVCNEFREEPDSLLAPPRDCHNEYGSTGARYHYRNHFDPDNDYNEYPD
jgi:hypothetical protein